jgi:hypothetical protein
VLGPDDVAARGGLQVVVDALAAGPAVLSLRPGVYPLAAPLVLQKNHNGLVIEGCCPTGAQLTAAGTDLTPFRTGLIVLEGVENITLRQLEIVAPGVLVNPKNTKTQLSTLCGVMVAEALALTIERCTFTLNAPSATTFGGGILVFGPTRGVTLRQNWFTAGAQVGEIFGVLALVTDSDASAELDQWDIVDNRFDNLAFAVVGFAQLGLVGCRHNVAAGCGAGFVFAEANLGATAGFTNAALNDQNNTTLGFAANAAMRPDILAGMAASAAPIMSAKPSTPAVQKVSSAAQKVLSDQLNQSGVDVYQQMTAGAATADPPAPAPAAAAKASPKSAKSSPVDATYFNAINAIAVAAEVSQIVLTPAIRLEDNEVTLIAGASAPWVGLAALLSPDEPGSVIVNGNRVVVPDATTVACAVMFPAGAVVSGNLLAQSVAAPAGTPATPCLIVLSRSPAIMVGANVASFSELVIPQRSPPSTAIWDFLNTTG